jgi:adenine-specific DNA-methyltransferase
MYENYSKEELIKLIQQLELELENKKYGLVWDKEREPEQVVLNCQDNLPILKEVKDKHIKTDNSDDNILIEGDNYHALSVLNYTHENKVDVIYIDPPYNTGENDFKYNDKYVEEEDKYRHSKWLNFMEKRLNLASKILNETGVIIVHIDEHEIYNLQLLLIKIFGDKNNLGTIVWNKKNPKGDSQGVSVMHESVLCFAKNKEKFLELDNTLKRAKPNAQKILKKASQLYKKLGKTLIPDQVKEVIKPFNYPKEVLKDFEVTYTLELINKEFQSWLSRQEFSGGEKAYKFIDMHGRVYRGVSMAWPNKKKAPDSYFIPLVHPKTNKPCPVPARGWRNPPSTMKNLLENDLILFGFDETKQPERKYLLTENMFENTTSLFENGTSDDELFKDLEIDFAYPKPVEVAKYFLSTIHPRAKVICDFVAGSGTTGQAVLELNQCDDLQRQFILCTNNENAICTDVLYPRLEKVINGYTKRNGNKTVALKSNLKYFQTKLLPRNKSYFQTKIDLVNECTEMLCIKESIYDIEVEQDDYKIFSSNDKTRYLAVYYNTEDDSLHKFLDALRVIKEEKIVYMFSENEELDQSVLKGIKRCKLHPIPQKILNIYHQLNKQNIAPKTNTIFVDIDKAKRRIFDEKDKDDGASKLRIVLEQIIEYIAYKNGLNVNDFSSIARVNTKLKDNGIFTKVIWKENEKYLTIGNDASHGDYGNYEMKQVKEFYKYVQSLITKFSVGK